MLNIVINASFSRKMLGLSIKLFSIISIILFLTGLILSSVKISAMASVFNIFSRFGLH